MNSLQRIQAAVAFQATDRVPVLPQVFGHAAFVARETMHDYVRSGEVMAQCQLKALDRYGHDAVFAVMDANVESEAVGSKLAYRPDDYPYVRSHVLSEGSQVSSLSVPDPGSAARMPEVLRALALLRGSLGDEVLVVGCALGPMTLASQLLGLEQVLYLAVDEPAVFEKLLDFSTEVLIRFGKAQIGAGAHLPMIFDPAASPDVIPPAFFREFERPRLQRALEAFSASGALCGWLHIAGPTTPILPSCRDIGAGILNFDYVVAPSDFMEKAPSVCGNGNIKCVDFQEGTPEEIHRQADRLMDQFRLRGGFILSSGCEIPLMSKPENVDAMVAASRAWS